MKAYIYLVGLSFGINRSTYRKVKKLVLVFLSFIMLFMPSSVGKIAPFNAGKYGSCKFFVPFLGVLGHITLHKASAVGRRNK
mmetsp:Transcript_56034/g.81958  ORF Transcript_56034/g.81958 Transcript_56034/m.81958 type:complete len:82 (-) Transcript_56034:292-537(-)